MIEISKQEKTRLHFRRFEWKYIIDRVTMNKIISDLYTYMEFDPYIKLSDRSDNDGKPYYTVKSIYFDNSGLSAYQEKMAGCGFRKKMRVRSYEQSVLADSPIFLEIKRKKGEIIIKDRMMMGLEECKNFLNGETTTFQIDNLSEAERDFLSECHWLYDFNCMRPVVYVAYKRCAFVDKIRNNFRLTFDYDINSALVNGEMDFGILEDQDDKGPIIMEVKYNETMPKWFYDIIKKHNLWRLSFSKYCFGIQENFNIFNH